MVDIQQRTLCAFGQYIFTSCQSLVYLMLCVGEGEATHIVDTFEPSLFFVGDIEICKP